MASKRYGLEDVAGETEIKERALHTVVMYNGGLITYAPRQGVFIDDMTAAAPSTDAVAYNIDYYPEASSDTAIVGQYVSSTQFEPIIK